MTITMQKAFLLLPRLGFHARQVVTWLALHRLKTGQLETDLDGDLFLHQTLT
jgi:hypothetical protein